MRAARFSRFGGPEVLEIVDLPDPHPGPGEVRIAVHAAGLSASDWKKRQGLMDQEPPQTLGYEAAGIVDKVGDGVTNVAVGDHVFGFSRDGAAQAELAVLSAWAPIPSALSFVGAAALPSAVETARGIRVIGTGSPATHDDLRKTGAEPVAYGEGMNERVRALAPEGVDRALDVAGSGVLPELIGLAGGAEHVLTIADFSGAKQYGVRFSRGDSGRAVYSLALVVELVDSGRFSLTVGQTFPLADVAEAHRVGEAGGVRGKLVLLVA